MADLVVPGEKLIALTDGRAITVKTKLNAGENYDLMAASVTGPVEPGAKATIDPSKAPVALMLAYLLAWNLTDDAGVVIPLPRPVPDDADNTAARRAAVRAIEFERFTEIVNAITAHDAETRKKKPTPSGSGSPSTSESPAAAAGAMTG